MEDRTQKFQNVLNACLTALDGELKELEKTRDELKEKAQDLKPTHAEQV